VTVGGLAALALDNHIPRSNPEHGHALAQGMSPPPQWGGVREGSRVLTEGGAMHGFDASRGLLGGQGMLGAHITSRPT
jgi:pyruvate dehydrogenase E1 component subunit alpha